MSAAEPADRSPYRGYRFPPEIIAHAVWLYFRFHLNFRQGLRGLAEQTDVPVDERVEEAEAQRRGGQRRPPTRQDYAGTPHLASEPATLEWPADAAGGDSSADAPSSSRQPMRNSHC